MAQSARIEPDISFIRELQAAGGETVKKCYQCATCSVACPISPADNPYPRKEMIWAQWGLKDKLLADPDIWLCYNCGGCSDLCPRGARPADLMAAMRNMAYKKMVEPTVIGTWMSDIKHLPILIAIPAVLFLFLWWFMASINFHGYFPHGGMFPIPKPGVGIEFARVFYGDYIIDPLFMFVVGFVIFSFYKGITRLIANIGPQGSVMVLGKRKHWLQCLVETIILEILPHTRFAECGDAEEKRIRKTGHMALVFGFIALAIVTGTIAFGHWVGRIPFLSGIYIETPLPLGHPIKILANIGMILLLVGLTYLTLRRKGLDAAKQSSSYYDWYLLGVIWAVAVTGMGSQLFRLAGLTAPAFITYYIHLVAVFMLFAYLPWSKLGHLVYRTAAITYVRYMGRK